MSTNDCLMQALKLHPDDKIVQRRVASEQTHMKRYNEALCLLDDSLEQEESWFAYRHRGLLRLEMYEDKDYAPEQQKKELLFRAKNDFERAMSIKEVHADHSDIGYVFYLLGDNNSAINHFAAAVNCTQDDNFDPSITHKRWANCLRAIGEQEGAMRQLQLHDQTLIRLRHVTNTLEDAFSASHGETCRGNDCDLSRFHYRLDSTPGYVEILSEKMTPSQSMQCTQTPRNKTHKYDFFVSFSHIDYKWSLAFINKLEGDLKLRGCVRHRDYDVGEAMARNTADAIRNSYRLIIVVSPDSLKDPLCKYEVVKAQMENIYRTCVVPIILRQSRMPQEIDHLTNIRSLKGQFLKEDWARLERFIAS